MCVDIGEERKEDFCLVVFYSKFGCGRMRGYILNKYFVVIWQNWLLQGGNIGIQLLYKV